MKIPRTNLLYVLDGLAVLTFIATFSSVVIPQNQSEPFFMGIPYTMWMGFAVSVLFVVLAYLVSIIYKKDNHAD